MMHPVSAHPFSLSSETVFSAKPSHLSVPLLGISAAFLHSNTVSGRRRGGEHPTLWIICKKIGFPLGNGIGISHGPAAAAGWPERTSTALACVALLFSQPPEKSRRGPDRPERFLFEISGNQADSSARHDRAVAGKSYP